MRSGSSITLASLALVALAGLSGCGTPGAPLPPSLHLAQPVTDLTATRTGEQVALRWTNPKKTTDRQTIPAAPGEIEARICRGSTEPSKNSSCQSVQTLPVLSGKETTWTDSLPTTLATGAPRPLYYTVELLNRRGRSAGPSEPAVALAGAAPPPILDFSAAMRADGVALSWQANNSTAPVRLHRRLLTPAPAKHSESSFGQQSAEPVERDLTVDVSSRISALGTPNSAAGAGALDKDIRFGQRYAYTAQRVVFVTAGDRKLELDGAVSPPVQVDTKDIFPPAVPDGLAAVFAATTNSIDLSWEPDTETDLAGYVVFRSEDGHLWQRISSAKPVPVPTFEDTHVNPGTTYHYAVSAIDLSGNESRRSVPATESVPEKP